MKLLTEAQRAKLIQNGQSVGNNDYQILTSRVMRDFISYNTKSQEQPMELLDYDEQRNVTLKLSEQEFTELCDILSCVAGSYRDLDPSLLMVEEERVSLLSDEIHAVLEKLTEHERRRHGK